jgi:hypothetical protein
MVDRCIVIVRDPDDGEVIETYGPFDNSTIAHLWANGYEEDHVGQMIAEVELLRDQLSDYDRGDHCMLCSEREDV